MNLHVSLYYKYYCVQLNYIKLVQDLFSIHRYLIVFAVARLNMSHVKQNVKDQGFHPTSAGEVDSCRGGKEEFMMNLQPL